jgi:tryptophan halogenase
MAVKKVAILGGGTSGWLTAIFFKKVWPELEITVIEDPKSPPIIAGESCTAPFVDLIDFLDIDTNDWIKKTDAFPKLGGKFVDWGPNKSTFTQPLFSSYRNRWDYTNIEFGEDNVLLKGMLALGIPLKDITVSGHLLDKKMTPFTKNGHVVRPMYHFDSRKNAEYFKKIGLDSDINVILSKYKSCTKNNQGIETLILEDREFSADFYIDCSGFNQLILKKELNAKFTDFSKFFTATGVIAWWDQTELKPYSNMIAMDYGWRFNIDLQSRSGNGYIYDTSLLSADQAKDEVERKFGKTVDLVANAKWAPEMALHPWQQNVIAIGLSNGFLEPLGSGGHTMIAMMLRLLSECWSPCIETQELARKRFNTEYENIVEDTVDFIALHYRNGRADTEFWKRHLSSESIPDSLQSKLEHYKFGNLYDTGSAYSIENYCVVAQAYNLIDKELLANTLRHKNNNMLEKITQEYTQLTAEIGYISKNCMSTSEWKKIYD